MKRINKRILLGIIIFMMPVFVYADSIIINCPSEVDKNSEFSCTVSGNTSKYVTSISANIKSNNLTMLSFTNAQGWLGDALDGNMLLYTADDMTNDFSIGVLKYRSGNTVGSVTIDTVIFYDENDQEMKIDTVSKIINIKESNVSTNNSSNNSNSNNNSNDNNDNNDNKEEDNDDNNESIITGDGSEEFVSNNYLVDIQIEKYDIDFDKEIFEYTLKIQKEKKLEITPVLEDSTSRYEIINNKNLVNGSRIEIKVISQENEERLYIINIEKEEEKTDYTLLFVSIIVILIIINIVRIIVVRRKKYEE